MIDIEFYCMNVGGEGGETATLGYCQDVEEQG